MISPLAKVVHMQYVGCTEKFEELAETVILRNALTLSV